MWSGLRSPRAVLWGLLVLLFVFPSIDVALFGFSRVFQYLSADAFYYLTVAANFPAAGFFTFDQSLPTNGFHPLWQAVLAAAALALQHTADLRVSLIAAAFALSLLFATAGLLLAARRAIPRLGSCDFLLLLAPMGLALLGAGWFEPRHVALWSQVNGMESGLAIFFFGALVYFMLGEGELTAGRAAALGLVLGLLVLSRLDMIFFFPAIALTGGLEICSADRRKRAGLLRGYLLLLSVGSLLVLAYVAIDLAATGDLIPVSARFKSSFPHVEPRNVAPLAALWLAFTDPAPLARKSFWVAAADVVPLMVAVIEIAFAWVRWRRRRPFDPWSRLLLTLALALCGLHLYLILFVWHFAQGSWYFAVAEVATILIVAGWMARSARLRGLLEGRAVLARAAAFAASATFFVAVYLAAEPIGPSLLEDRSYSPASNYYTFQERDRVREFYGGELPKIVELDDGIIAYSFGAPTLSGLRFCLDPESARHLLAGNGRDLLSLAYRRGYDRLASSHYMYHPIIYSGAPSPVLTEFLHRSVALEDLTPFRWQVEYLSRTFFILRFEPIAGGPAASGDRGKK